jgi:hypothetical protein
VGSFAQRCHNKRQIYAAVIILAARWQNVKGDIDQGSGISLYFPLFAPILDAPVHCLVLNMNGPFHLAFGTIL